MFSSGKARLKKKLAKRESNDDAKHQTATKVKQHQQGKGKPAAVAKVEKGGKGGQQQQQQQQQLKRDARKERDKTSGASSAASRKKFQQAGRKGGDIIEMFRQKLEGSTFRLLNEQIYTSPNAFAVQLLRQKQTFNDYHQGYRHQLQQWPVNPNQVIIDALRGDQRGRFLQNKAKSIPGYIPTSWQIADMGAGDAQIARALTDTNQPRQYKVHSFDLCSSCELVTACDMAHTPLADNSIEICIFSLSLMATDWLMYIAEAHRILKPKRLLKIVEVRSRLPNPRRFAEVIEGVGFTLDWYDVVGSYFVAFDFIRNEESAPNMEPVHYPADVLQPCLYKRR